MQTWPDNNEFMEFLRIFMLFKIDFSVNSIGTEGTVYNIRTFYNSIIN